VTKPGLLEGLSSVITLADADEVRRFGVNARGVAPPVPNAGVFVVTSIDRAAGAITFDRMPSPAGLLELWNQEIQDVTAKFKRELSRWLWDSDRVMPWVCPDATLERRARYGGRKGRRAAQRLAERERAREKVRRRYEDDDEW
jgi:hypothetical protein